MRRIGGTRSLRAPVMALLVVSTASAGVLVPSAATAAPATGVPIVGECLDLPVESLVDRGGWLEPVAVPCTQEHTFEVTRVGALPPLTEADDPTDLAAEECGALGVWNEVGVNRPRAGVVEDPLRIEARSFAVLGPQPAFVCGAVAVEWSRVGELVVLPLTTAIEDLTTEEREALRYCSRARGVRRPWTVPTTVSCSTEPRWEETAWVLWTAFYDDDPGRARLRARARAICGEGARISLPTSRDWAVALPWTRCFERIS